MLHSPGRTRLPPSQPHAASSAAAPLLTPRVTNARLSMPCGLASWRLGVCLLVMARKAAPVRSSEDCAPRGGIYGEHENDGHELGRDQKPPDPEVAVARPLKTRAEGRQRGGVAWLV